MDINDIRSVYTVVAFVFFLGIVVWAYSGKRKQAFDEAAMLALDDDGISSGSSVAAPKKERN